MELAGLIIFCSALFLAAASPGPGLAAIVGRVLGRGAKGAIGFTVGVALGDVVWLTLAVGGLAIVAQTFHLLFIVVKWIGVSYLLFLAWKMWSAPTDADAVAADTRQESQLSLFLAGLAVTMGNPKVMMFYLALLPTILDLNTISFVGYLELVLATLSVLAVVFGIYVGLAEKARLLFMSPAAKRRANRTSAAAMTGAAAWVATR
ncbi:MAG TPA: LysE family translocator [Hyphomicrobiaceae bacterium]|nr:LysE family translocator [Hyphomicrobiaceae bacterium]